MPEETPQVTKETVKAKPVADGFSEPIPEPGEGKSVPDHIHPDTLMAKGIDPDTREIVSVSLPVLQKKHGEKKGMRLYSKVAKAGGFLDPDMEVNLGSHFYPDLSLDGLSKDARAKVDAILEEV